MTGKTLFSTQNKQYWQTYRIDAQSVKSLTTPYTQACTNNAFLPRIHFLRPFLLLKTFYVRVQTAERRAHYLVECALIDCPLIYLLWKTADLGPFNHFHVILGTLVAGPIHGGKTGLFHPIMTRKRLGLPSSRYHFTLNLAPRICPVNGLCCRERDE